MGMNPFMRDNPFMMGNPFGGSMSPSFLNQMPSNQPTNDDSSFDIDDLVKKIDAKIAEIEKEESEAKESQNSNLVEELTPINKVEEKPQVSETVSPIDNSTPIVQTNIDSNMSENISTNTNTNNDNNNLYYEDNTSDDDFFDDFFSDD